MTTNQSMLLVTASVNFLKAFNQDEATVYLQSSGSLATRAICSAVSQLSKPVNAHDAAHPVSETPQLQSLIEKWDFEQVSEAVYPTSVGDLLSYVYCAPTEGVSNRKQLKARLDKALPKGTGSYSTQMTTGDLASLLEGDDSAALKEVWEAVRAGSRDDRDEFNTEKKANLVALMQGIKQACGEQRYLFDFMLALALSELKDDHVSCTFIRSMTFEAIPEPPKGSGIGLLWYSQWLKTLKNVQDDGAKVLWLKKVFGACVANQIAHCHEKQSATGGDFAGQMKVLAQLYAPILSSINKSNVTQFDTAPGMGLYKRQDGYFTPWLEFSREEHSLSIASALKLLHQDESGLKTFLESMQLYLERSKVVVGLDLDDTSIVSNKLFKELFKQGVLTKKFNLQEIRQALLDFLRLKEEEVQDYLKPLWENMRTDISNLLKFLKDLREKHIVFFRSSALLEWAQVFTTFGEEDLPIHTAAPEMSFQIRGPFQASKSADGKSGPVLHGLWNESMSYEFKPVDDKSPEIFCQLVCHPCEELVYYGDSEVSDRWGVHRVLYQYHGLPIQKKLGFVHVREPCVASHKGQVEEIKATRSAILGLKRKNSNTFGPIIKSEEYSLPDQSKEPGQQKLFRPQRLNFRNFLEKMEVSEPSVT